MCNIQEMHPEAGTRWNVLNEGRIGILNTVICAIEFVLQDHDASRHLRQRLINY